MSEALWTLGVVFFLIGCVYVLCTVGAYRHNREIDKDDDGV